MPEETQDKISLAILGEKIDNLAKMIERHMVTNEKEHNSIETGLGLLSERVRKNENSITEIKTRQIFINVAQAVWAPIAGAVASILRPGP